MKIWLINIGEQIPSDPGTPRLLRTGILAQHLVERGHDVTWWNATVNHQEKIQRFPRTTIRDTPEGYRMIQLYGRLYQRNISPGRILSLIENAREFKRIAPQEERPDVILCGYPSIELAKAATEFAIGYDIPIAIDFRDMWPDVFEERIPKPLRWSGKVLFAHWRQDLRFCARHATGVTGITDAFVDWAVNQGERNRGNFDRPFHLAVNPQTPDDTAILEAEEFWNDAGIPNNDDAIVGCFAGVLSKRLDLQTLIVSAKKLPEDLKDKIRLVFCGRGDMHEELCAMAGDEPHILFAGWRNAAELNVLLRRSHFGILPYPSTKDFQMSYPNKLGEYFSAGLPVMTGLKGITRSLLGERDLGYFYAEGNADSVTRCLTNMLADKSKISLKREPALQAYRELFDGAQIYPAFCDYLEELAHHTGKANGSETNE